MDELIKALQILQKHIDSAFHKKFPTHCGNEILLVMGIDEGAVPYEEVARLKELGFEWNEEYDCWASFRFGAC